ncbi:MAG: MFS transporter [Anaerolineaceae bacterium]|nr:MFS transporter [Anaerolineaceae bacterium]
MTEAVQTIKSKPRWKIKTRSRNYMLYLIIFMGLVAVMDQYISTVKTTAIPYILEEFNITASRFSYLEAFYLSFTFLIFLLNGLNDIIGRRWSILILILIMGLSSLGIVFLSPTLHSFMICYIVATFATVSNMWTMPISEESPAEKRAKYVALVYIIGLIPLQAILPPLLMNTLGLSWKWMYGVMFILMLPLLVMWMKMKEPSRFEVVQAERRDGTRKKHVFGLGVITKRDVRYILISAAIWLSWLIYQFFYFWAGYYFMEIKGYSLQNWSMTLLATLLMAILGGYLAGWVMDRIGRKPALIFGCIGLSIILVSLGFAEGFLLPVMATLVGFFTSFTYTWIVVYIPEVFPTERRGACMGWTTTIARVSYVVGPLLVGFLLKQFPTMEYFWVCAGAVMLLPIGIVLLFNPSETRNQELEAIEVGRE